MGILARFPQTSGDNATTPDAAGFSALGDFSVILLVSLDDWTPTAQNDVFCHSAYGTANRSWSVVVTTAGRLGLGLSTSGTSETQYTSNVLGYADGTMKWLLITRASSTGTIKFYDAAYTAGVSTIPASSSFTQIGSNVTGMTGTLANSGQTLNVGNRANNATTMLKGDVRRAVLYSGIYGSSPTMLCDFHPTDAGSTSATSWTSVNTGETWTLNGGDVLLIGDTKTGSGAIAGDGQIAGTGSKFAVKSGSGSISGSGAISSSGVRTASGSAAIAGDGQISSTGRRTAVSQGSIAGDGAISSTGARTALGQAAIAGNGAISGTGASSGAKTGSAAIDGTGTISSVGVRTTFGQAAISGNGLFSATGQLTRFGSGTIDGGGLFSATGNKTAFSTAAIVGDGTITASGEVPAPPIPTVTTAMLTVGSHRLWQKSRSLTLS